jgi:hypothetical protein
MIYTQIEHLTFKQTENLRKELETIPGRIEALRASIKVEDSKSREAGLREEIKTLTTRQHQIWGEISGIKDDAFRKALAVEYGVVGNPKFDKAYSVAYQHGHSSGFSDIEIYFSELVELIK